MKKIILGVTGSVAAIKTNELIAGLSQIGKIRIVVTHAAEYFIHHELDIIKQKDISIYRDQDEWPNNKDVYQIGDPILHIEMRRWADCLVIAPIDANTLAKMSYGFCDNLLTSIIRAWDYDKPLIVCPAMNTMMWENKPTQEHIKILESRGVNIIKPIEKQLACQDFGMGAMAHIEDIIKWVTNL